jgi:aminoglycoside 6'-N-acetyltransferase I
MTTVRRPRAEDRDEWLRMRRSLWPDRPDKEHVAEIAGYVRGEAAPPFSHSTGEVVALVAERDGGGLCGFVEASIRPYAEGVGDKPVGYVEGWFVDADVRRQGVGRALAGAAETWARSKGCRRMASDAHIDNTVSIESHTRLGYREIERLVHFVKELG